MIKYLNIRVLILEVNFGLEMECRNLLIYKDYGVIGVDVID